MSRFKLSSAQLILLSFAGLILAGTGLLMLPLAAQDHSSMPFIDALFTATSASCVTGLVVVNTMSHWSWFGKLVIISLIQLGGIGIITVVSGIMLQMRRHLGLRGRLTVQAAFNQNQLNGMGSLVKLVLRYTLSIEAAGAVLLTLGFYTSNHGYGFFESLIYGIFHAISAFCNAGFDIVGQNSLVGFQTNWLVNLTIMALIVLGGLGFLVLYELQCFAVRDRTQRTARRWRRFSLHTKLVLVTTLVLLVGGTLMFALLEWHNPKTLGPLSTAHKWLAAAFESVTLRTAGFLTIDQGAFSDYSKLIASTLMFVGGSPAGTAGGMKTVSLAVLVVAVTAAMKGHEHMVVFKRKLSLAMLQKALSVAGMLAMVTLLSVLVLHFSERGNPFHPGVLDLVFETTSAVGTVGLTTGMTPTLSVIGKGVLILCMFIGRLSPLTLAIALAMKQQNLEHHIDYPEEDVIIG